MILQHLSFLSKEKVVNVKESYWSIKKTYQKQYERANWNQSVIVSENFQKKIIGALAIVNSSLSFVACLSDTIEKMHGEIK